MFDYLHEVNSQLHVNVIGSHSPFFCFFISDSCRKQCSLSTVTTSTELANEAAMLATVEGVSTLRFTKGRAKSWSTALALSLIDTDYTV